MIDESRKLLNIINEHGAQCVKIKQCDTYPSFDVVDSYDNSHDCHVIFYGRSGEEYLIHELTMIDQYGNTL